MIILRLASIIRHQNWPQIITEMLIIGIDLDLEVQGWSNPGAGYEAHIVDRKATYGLIKRPAGAYYNYD